MSYKRRLFNYKNYRHCRESRRKEKVMSDFTPINTQEEFNEAIKDRIKRERTATEEKYKNHLSPEDVAKKYEGYLSPEEVKKKYEGYISSEEAVEKDKKIKGYETDSVKMRIAHEMELPYDAVKFLRGDDEKSIKESAEALKGIMGTHSNVPPLYQDEPLGDGKKGKEQAAFKTMLADMKGE